MKGKFNHTFGDISRSPELQKATNVVIVAEIDGKPQLWSTGDERQSEQLLERFQQQAQVS